VNTVTLLTEELLLHSGVALTNDMAAILPAAVAGSATTAVAPSSGRLRGTRGTPATVLVLTITGRGRDVRGTSGGSRGRRRGRETSGRRMVAVSGIAHVRGRVSGGRGGKFRSGSLGAVAHVRRDISGASRVEAHPG
jgi:hypothetical protein